MTPAWCYIALGLSAITILINIVADLFSHEIQIAAAKFAFGVSLIAVAVCLWGLL